MSEVYDPTAESKARRAGHRESSPAMLRGAGIRGEVDANGKQRYHRGVRLLIKRLRGVPRG